MRLAILGFVGLLAAASPAFAGTPQQVAAQQVAATSAVPVAAAPVITGSPLEIRTLKDVVDACSVRNDSPYYIAATSLCAGYVQGVLDFHLLDTIGPRQNKRKVCLPTPTPTRRAILADLVSWSRSAPQYMDEPAASAVLRYFINTYPCHRRTFQWSPPGPMQ